MANVSTTKSPFEVLDLASDASERMIASAYRALARKFHPDTTQLDRSFAGQKMAELNWAKRELDQNQVYWANWSRTQSLVPGRNRVIRPWENSLALVPLCLFVVPDMLWLPDRPGHSALIAASSPGVSPSDIRVRFNPRSFEVERLEPNGSRAFFQVIRRANPSTKARHPDRLQIVVPGLSIEKTVHVHPFAVSVSAPAALVQLKTVPQRNSSDDWFLRRLGHVMAGAR